MRIDLHTHSSASDGTDTRGDLVRGGGRRARRRRADRRRRRVGLGRGAAHRRRGRHHARAGPRHQHRFHHRGVHLLAYLPDPDHEPLAAALDRILVGRTERTPAMVAALREHGIDITEDDVRREAGGSVAAGRPHVADALVRLGVVGDRTQAFAVARPRAAGLPQPLRRRARGHGRARGRRRRGPGHRSPVGSRIGVLDEAALASLKDLGLAGVEVDHQDHPPDARRLRASPPTSTSW